MPRMTGSRPGQPTATRSRFDPNVTVAASSSCRRSAATSGSSRRWATGPSGPVTDRRSSSCCGRRSRARRWSCRISICWIPMAARHRSGSSRRNWRAFQSVGRVMWHPDGKRVSFRGALATQPQQIAFWTQPIAGGPAVRSDLADGVAQELKTQGVGILNVRWAPAARCGVHRGSRSRRQEPLAD